MCYQSYCKDKCCQSKPVAWKPKVDFSLVTETVTPLDMVNKHCEYTVTGFTIIRDERELKTCIKEISSNVEYRIVIYVPGQEEPEVFTVSDEKDFKITLPTPKGSEVEFFYFYDGTPDPVMKLKTYIAPTN